MDLVSLRRQHTKWAIQQNPTTITIHRTEKIDAGGYFEEVESEVGPFVVRLFQQRGESPGEIAGLAGTKQTYKTWGLLADHQADLQAGPNVKDEFSVPDLGHFLVAAVYPQIIQGQVVGLQADLEAVK